jgi:hypothetical protein
MRRALPLIIISSTFAIAGCQSHEANVVNLQKEHDRLAAQFRQDCPPPKVGEVPPPPTQQCQNEDQKLGELEKQIKAEQLKQ